MASDRQGLRVRAGLKGNIQLFEMNLSRRVFSRGGQLSGVLLVRLPKPVSIKSILVSVTGGEVVKPGKARGPIRPGDLFFRREALLTGRDRPRLASERISLHWNTFLKREDYRVLSAGEHAYPFSISLPGSLPPSCEGAFGRIVYTVTARIKLPLGRSFQVTTEVPVTHSLRELSQEPFVETHSSIYTGKHATGADMKIELPSRGFAMGSTVAGKLTIMNPRRVSMDKIEISLDVCDGAGNGSRGGAVERNIAGMTIVPEDSTAEEITADLQIPIPADAPPSVEGKCVLVTWSLGISVGTCPPLEMRVPVLAHLPVT